MAIDHVSLAVRDLARSAAFYEATLAPLGYTKLVVRERMIGFGKTHSEIWINLRENLPPPPADVGAQPEVIHVAQSREAAELALRIQQLEEQIRVLTGQVEGLQFQLTQMQTLIENQTKDNEFRFQQLEGGAGGKPQAATESGGAMPTGGLPQAPAEDVGMVDNPMPADQMPMDSIGESQDPLVGTGGGDGQLGE